MKIRLESEVLAPICHPGDAFISAGVRTNSFNSCEPLVYEVYEALISSKDVPEW